MQCRQWIWFGLFLSSLFGPGLPSYSQPGTKKIKKVKASFQPFVLDSLTLIEPSLKCLSDTSLRFRFDFKTNTLEIKSVQFSEDSLVLEYRTFPFAAYKPLFKFGRELYDSILDFSDYPGLENQNKEKREELFSLPGIQKTGAITRGISLGNNQNGFVNSSMNLQLEGQLSPQIKLTAVLSDQNVPFQPQGNTQQIRELDRILIQLDHKQGQLQTGDVVLKNEPSQFLRYYKNIQGGQALARWDSASENSQTRLAGGIAKGKFASMVLQVREGVQGPYRLRPPNNPDLAVVILANSERIFFDNRLLKRGFNYDYVIDYNTGELTLNNNLLVTQFTRLRCDFEYAERNYSRTTWMAEHSEKVGIAKIQISHYQEQDNPSRPLSFNLDSTNTRILREAGDNPAKAILPSQSLVENYSEGQLLYTQKDTVLAGELIFYFVRAQKTDSPLFQLVFSEVGIGNGDYQLIENLGNGKIFQFVGKGQGTFLPVRQAVLPNLRSMSRAALELEPGKGHKIGLETAFSRFDKNRFSFLDEADNAGNAQYLAYSFSPQKAKNGLQYQMGAQYTRLSKNFNAIDRFRPIEFERDWNANAGDTLAADDHLVEASVSLKKNEKWSIQYTGAGRDKGKNVSGLQQNLGVFYRMGGFLIQNQSFVMMNKRQFEKADWYRNHLHLSFDKYALVPSYQYLLDENQIWNTETDSALRTAMHFQSHGLSLRSKDTSGSFFVMGYTYREDKKPFRGTFEKEQFSQNGFARANWDIHKNQKINFFLNYRQVNYRAFTQIEPEENLSGRMDYSGNFWEGAMRHELTYTANTGQEQKRTFQFIRINAVGEGSHQWKDFNGNGLQELDEFVEAQRPEDKVYIKVFTPTNEFIRAYTNSLNYRLNLASPFSWRNAGGLKGLVARFSILSNIQADQKSISGNLSDRYVPLQNSEQENIVASNQIFRNTFFWNRTQSNVGADYSLLNSRQKTLLSNGFSLRQINEHRLLVRKNLSNWFNLNQMASFFERILNSDALQNQNYAVEGWDLGPELSFQPNASHRISGNGSLGKRKNRQGEEKSETWKLGLEYRFNQQSNRTLNAWFRLTEIKFRGNENSAASYELLEGLRPGQNLTWAVNLQQKLTQGLQILFTYEGRKSDGIRTIHLGKMQASLLF